MIQLSKRANRRAVLASLLAFLFSTEVAVSQTNADNCSVVNQGNENKTFLVCGDLQLEVKFDEDKYLSALDARVEEIREEEIRKREELRKHLESENEIKALKAELRIRTLEQELDQINQDKANFDAAYKSKLQQLSKTLNGLLSVQSRLSEDDFANAIAAILAGNDNLAYELLEEVEAGAQDTIELVARSNFEQGRIAENQYRWQQAAEDYQRAFQFVPDNIEYAQKSANFLAIIGDDEAAIIAHQKIISLIENGERLYSDELLAGAYTDAAVVYWNAGRIFEAQRYFEQSLDVIEGRNLNMHEEMGKCLACLGLIFISLERFEEAEVYLERSLEVLRETGDIVQLADTTGKFGNLHFRKGENEKSIEYYLKAINLLEANGKQWHPDSATKYHNLAFVLERTGRPCDAVEYYEKALSVVEKALGRNHRDYKLMSANFDELDRSQCS